MLVSANAVSGPRSVLLDQTPGGTWTNPQTLIIHVIRTNRIPFIQSRASWPLMLTTLSIMAFGMWLPWSPLASALGLVRPPGLYWPILALTLLAYMSLTQVIKVWLLRKKWI